MTRPRLHHVSVTTPDLDRSIAERPRTERIVEIPELSREDREIR